jgi:hypothetical protein
LPWRIRKKEYSIQCGTAAFPLPVIGHESKPKAAKREIRKKEARVRKSEDVQYKDKLSRAFLEAQDSKDIHRLGLHFIRTAMV